MPRYEPDIIAALAEGRLDPEEAERLEREIAADPAAAAELADHRAALAFVADAPRPELTTEERTELRASIADALGLAEPTATTESTPSRRIAWGPLGIAAAALAGLVAVVPVVGLLSTGGSDDTAAVELASEAAATTSAPTAAAELRTSEEDQTDTATFAADEEDGLSPGDDATSEAAPFGSSTTRATTTTTQGAASEQTTTTPPQTASADATTTTSGPEGLEELTQELQTLRSDPDAMAALSPQPADENLSCWVEDNGVRADPPPERLVFEYQRDELTVIVYYEETSDGVIGPFQVWGVPDCAELVVVGE